MKGKMTERKIGLIVLIVLILLFAGLYISLIFNKNIWTDEAYTMELVRENHFWGIIQNTANDVHPPLYYLIVKCFVLLFGDTFLVYKAVSIIPMVLTMLLAVSHIRPWWGERAAVLFLIMVNAIPCVLEYVVQMRMYSWALFFVTWAGLSAYGMCMKEDKQIGKCCCIQLTAASLLGCYTHTYAMLSCVCIYMLLCVCVLLQCRKRKDWILLKVSLLSGSTVAVCYLPWLVILLRQTMSRIENYWIEPVTWEVIRKYPDFLFASRLPGSAVLYLVLCGAAVLVCINRCRKKSDGDWEGLTALMMLAVPLLTALIGIVVSVLVTPFFIARYLLPCMGLFALFLALAFQEKREYVQILIGIFGLFMVLESYQKNIEMEYHITHTEELLAYMEEHLEPEDLIAYNFEIYGFIYNIYFEDRVTFLNDVDFAGDFGSVWYFDSCVT
ncbi:MAG: glycosyltransferase family 39 protein, partial [Lachnospiraceae bacterium]|nr:glycosyltransferase family 39 protein [Lachnospiraceae bacterium]